MSDALGTIIDGGDGGIAATDTNHSGTGNDSRRTSEPEIINGFEAESPTTERIATGDGATRKRRGRPPGSRNNTAQTATKESVRLESLKISDLLYSIHLMGAEMFKLPELELDKEESAKLADAIADVSKYYVTAFDPKKIAWVHLAVIAGGIYGTRFFAFRNRVALQKQIRGLSSRTNTKPATPDQSVPQAQKVNGFAREDGKIEIDPNSVWGMTTGEI